MDPRRPLRPEPRPKGRPRLEEREESGTEDDAILRAALGVLAERGFHGTIIPEIVRAAGVPTGSLYRRFPSKEQLANEAFRFAKRRLSAALAGRVDEGTPEVRFLAFWRALVAFARAEPEMIRFLELHDHTGYLDAESRAVELSVLMPLLTLVADLQARGVLSSSLRPDAMMALVWGAFVGLVRAERGGYLVLDDQTLEEAGRACFFAVTTHPPKKGKRAP